MLLNIESSKANISSCGKSKLVSLFLEKINEVYETEIDKLTENDKMVLTIIFLFKNFTKITENVIKREDYNFLKFI